MRRLLCLILLVPMLLGIAQTAWAASDTSIIEPQAIVDYLAVNGGTLPPNFITKKQAQQLGWDSSRNYLSDVAPGKSIGGGTYGNR